MGSFQKIGAVVHADLHLRFRTLGTIVTLLVVAGGVYLIVPDIRSGWALMQIGKQRVLYNSAAVALGTGMFCALIMSIVGYYLVSSSIRRDLTSRTGDIIAASPVKDAEYLLGKFLGNVIHLCAIAGACMASAMLMFLIRGERALEPLIFLWMYAWLILPVVVFVSATAIAFEALPLLSGRLGDIVYFFLWAGMVAVPAAFADSSHVPRWTASFDLFGLISVMGSLKSQYHTSSFSIGMNPFNPAMPPLYFAGFSFEWGQIAERLSTLIVPAGLLVLARLWFHRFNPERIKFSVRNGRANLLRGIDTFLRPLSRSLISWASMGRNGSSLAGAIRADVIITLVLSPLTTLAILACAILSLTLEMASLQEGLLPVIVAVAAIAVANLATRDQTARTMNILFTTPSLKKKYVFWKLASGLIVTFCFTMLPFVRLLFAWPSAALSLAIGSCLIACSAVGLGILSGSAKPFVACILMLLYIALNASSEPGFDFVGISGRATAGVQMMYASIALMVILVAQLRYRGKIRKV